MFETVLASKTVVRDRLANSLIELTGTSKVRKRLIPFHMPKEARTRQIQCLRWPTLFSKTENVPKRVVFAEAERSVYAIIFSITFPATSVSLKFRPA